MDTVPETIILLIVSVIFGDRILAAAGFNAGDRFVSIGPATNALVALVTVAFVLSRRSRPATNSSDREEETNGSCEIDLLNDVRY